MTRRMGSPSVVFATMSVSSFCFRDFSSRMLFVSRFEICRLGKAKTEKPIPRSRYGKQLVVATQELEAALQKPKRSGQYYRDITGLVSLTRLHLVALFLFRADPPSSVACWYLLRFILAFTLCPP